MTTTLVILLCAAVCPLSMAAMMLFMRLSHRRDRPDKSADDAEVRRGRAE